MALHHLTMLLLLLLAEDHADATDNNKMFIVQVSVQRNCHELLVSVS